MKFYDRVKTDTATANGLGDITWTAASAQYALPPVAVDEFVVYTVLDANGGAWETGRTTLTESTGTYTLARDGSQTVTASSNSGAATAFTTSSLHTLILTPDAQYIEAVAVGSMQIIQTETASASAEIALDLPASGYDMLEVEIVDVAPSVDAVTLSLQVSTDGGSTWESATDIYSYASTVANSWDAVTSVGADSTSIIVAELLGSVSGETHSSWIRVLNPDTSTGRPAFLISSVTRTSANKTTLDTRGAHYNSVGTAINALRFFTSSGNIAAGVFSLRGRVAA